MLAAWIWFYKEKVGHPFFTLTNKITREEDRLWGPEIPGINLFFFAKQAGRSNQHAPGDPTERFPMGNLCSKPLATKEEESEAKFGRQTLFPRWPIQAA